MPVSEKRVWPAGLHTDSHSDEAKSPNDEEADSDCDETELKVDVLSVSSSMPRPKV